MPGRYCDGLSGFSNWSPTAVHIAAPGEYIVSTLPQGATGYMSGTSMAAPFVSGSAALLLSVGGPNLTPAKLRQLLMDAAVKAPGLKGKVLSVSAPAQVLLASLMPACLLPYRPALVLSLEYVCIFHHLHIVRILAQWGHYAMD
jgi:hypothetical protein